MVIFPRALLWRTVHQFLLFSVAAIASLQESCQNGHVPSQSNKDLVSIQNFPPETLIGSYCECWHCEEGSRFSMVINAQLPNFHTEPPTCILVRHRNIHWNCTAVVYCITKIECLLCDNVTGRLSVLHHHLLSYSHGMQYTLHWPAMFLHFIPDRASSDMTSNQCPFLSTKMNCWPVGDQSMETIFHLTQWASSHSERSVFHLYFLSWGFHLLVNGLDWILGIVWFFVLQQISVSFGFWWLLRELPHWSRLILAEKIRLQHWLRALWTKRWTLSSWSRERIQCITQSMN